MTGQSLLHTFMGCAMALGIIFYLHPGDPYSLKRISDTSYRYEFYTTSKNTGSRQHKNYFWFKGGAIHSSQGGYAGELLDEDYKKFYLDNQLAEQGHFSKGLKTGLWKTWHRKGILATVQYYSKGLQTGMYHSYDENGALREKGNYRYGKKDGLWISYEKHDTLNFKKGIPVPLKRKLTKTQREQIKAEKERAKEEKKRQKEMENTSEETKKNPSAKKKSASPENEGFFKKLFGKSKDDGQSK